MKKTIKDFIICHEGVVNKLLHFIGLLLIIYSFWKLNIYLFLLGWLIQESGHFYQYFSMKEYKYSPLNCLKPQIIIIYPLIIAGAIYILLNQ